MTPITPNMRIDEILRRYPATAAVFQSHGIRCEGCHASRYESLGQGARVHGFDLGPLLNALNAAVTGPPITPRDRLPVHRN